jgi:hypothetical protein
MKRIIHEAFREEYQTWKDQGQKNLTGQYTLTVCENVELGKDDEYISIPIEKDGTDGGYLHVYGMREKRRFKRVFPKGEEF